MLRRASGPGGGEYRTYCCKMHDTGKLATTFALCASNPQQKSALYFHLLDARACPCCSRDCHRECQQYSSRALSSPMMIQRLSPRVEPVCSSWPMFACWPSAFSKSGNRHAGRPV
ncbi:hypothetical protein EJ06DRAFT_142033 [Trichodelitschia bisporula]|uniref:Uncharacterized protein n=1 Tax=Trichodelitschia bisporula TaxID=703511 RepID=A0A6G1HP94_9PEZI|nr:hypothetical protein EJ06DRAFT_142033 [Trichodelitschia bisporula]